MDFNWNFFIDAGFIGLALVIATLVRAKVRFFQKYLIPNALTGGFFLLIFYNFAAPRLGRDTAALGEIVYHLLSVSFIAMTLRKSRGRRKGRNLYAMTTGVLSQFAVQATSGLLLTLLLINTLFPDLFPSFGYLLPLGFAQGPGQAFAIGNGWEKFGFQGAGSVGLTFAAMGFLWACFGGVFLINYGIRKGWMTQKEQENLSLQEVKRGIIKNIEEKSLPVGSRLTTESEAIDTMTLNVAFVFGTYLLTFAVLKGITVLLSLAGPMGRDLAVNLWGLSFIFAAFCAMAVRAVVKAVGASHILDNGTLTRISGGAIDMMVAGAIGAISLVVVAQYWIPLLVVGLVGGTLTLITIPWICSRIFSDHAFHRTLILYGVSTGTLPTGLALLRVIDSEFTTPVATDYMFSTAITFVLAIPFILSINLPVYYKTTGDPLFLWLTLGVCAGYALLVGISVLILTRRNGIRPKRTLWKGDHHE